MSEGTASVELTAAEADLIKDALTQSFNRLIDNANVDSTAGRKVFSYKISAHYQLEVKLANLKFIRRGA